MSLSIQLSPPSIALIGNPIKLSVDSSSFVTYVVTCGEQEIYTGSGEGVFNVFIQDVLSEVVKPANIYNENIQELITVPGTIQQVTVSASNTEGDDQSITFKAIIGGVSKRIYRRLADANTNIFTYKLLNSSGNFFQTSRTTGRMITIRETELLPIPFLYPDEPIKVVAGGIETVLQGTTGEPYALNLYRLRKRLFEEHQVLPAVFEIYAGTHKSCTIVITPGTVSRERYVIQFLNSYGVYERIEVTGIGEISSEAPNEDTYMIYDELVDDYVEGRERQLSQDTLVVDSGYKTPEEFVFLMDLLSSDDITILGLDGRNVKVSASAENLTQAVRQSSPESLKLKLRFAEQESRHTGSLTEENFGDPRIHTEQFTQEFN